MNTLVFKMSMVVKDKKDNGNYLSDNDPVVHLMGLVRNCSEQSKRTLIANQNLFCTLDWEGNSVLNHAVCSNNLLSLQIICQSNFFKVIKNIPNRDGDYPVSYAALDGKCDILQYLLNIGCRILVGVGKDGCPPCLLQEVICRNINTSQVLDILFKDLSNNEKYPASEVNYMLSKVGYVETYGDVNPYQLACAMRKDDIARKIEEFSANYNRQIPVDKSQYFRRPDFNIDHLNVYFTNKLNISK